MIEENIEILCKNCNKGKNPIFSKEEQLTFKCSKCLDTFMIIKQIHLEENVELSNPIDYLYNQWDKMNKSKWISCKESLPEDKKIVIAKNPQCESISWIDGKNETGKPKWFHKNWEHADDFVTHWKPID